MSLRCQSWVYEFSESTGNDRLVLLAISDEADDDGTNAYPGIDRIAHKARVPKRTTLRCVDRLEAAGRIKVTRPETRGRGRFNTYVVVMGSPEKDWGKGDTLTPIPGVEGPGEAGADPDQVMVPERRVMVPERRASLPNSFQTLDPDSKNPPTPAERGSPTPTPNVKPNTPRAEGTNPRALGTNPRGSSPVVHPLPFEPVDDVDEAQRGPPPIGDWRNLLHPEPQPEGARP